MSADALQVTRKLVVLGDGGCGKVGSVQFKAEAQDITTDSVYKR